MQAYECCIQDLSFNNHLIYWIKPSSRANFADALPVLAAVAESLQAPSGDGGNQLARVFLLRFAVDTFR